MARKILVLGYFGLETGKLDGQTVKTRSVYAMLQQELPPSVYKLDFFDTEVLLPGGGLPSCAEQFGKVFPCAVPFLQAMGLRYPLHGDWRMAGCFPEGPSGAGAGLVKDKGCFS